EGISLETVGTITSEEGRATGNLLKIKTRIKRSHLNPPMEIHQKHLLKVEIAITGVNVHKTKEDETRNLALEEEIIRDPTIIPTQDRGGRRIRYT
ncbi:MAG: hypothetical protein AAFR59_02945, partial [Bacteroidota bacterium]